MDLQIRSEPLHDDHLSTKRRSGRVTPVAIWPLQARLLLDVATEEREEFLLLVMGPEIVALECLGRPSGRFRKVRFLMICLEQNT